MLLGIGLCGGQGLPAAGGARSRQAGGAVGRQGGRASGQAAAAAERRQRMGGRGAAGGGGPTHAARSLANRAPLGLLDLLPLLGLELLLLRGRQLGPPVLLGLGGGCPRLSRRHLDRVRGLGQLGGTTRAQLAGLPWVLPVMRAGAGCVWCRPLGTSG